MQDKKIYIIDGKKYRLEPVQAVREENGEIIFGMTSLADAEPFAYHRLKNSNDPDKEKKLREMEKPCGVRLIEIDEDEELL